jgi:hypothetical protein
MTLFKQPERRPLAAIFQFLGGHGSLWRKETLLAVPRIALLVPKLMSDERVPKGTKLALGRLAIYLASPWKITAF